MCPSMLSTHMSMRVQLYNLLHLQAYLPAPRKPLAAGGRAWARACERAGGSAAAMTLDCGVLASGGSGAACTAIGGLTARALAAVPAGDMEAAAGSDVPEDDGVECAVCICAPACAGREIETAAGVPVGLWRTGDKPRPCCLCQQRGHWAPN